MSSFVSLILVILPPCAHHFNMYVFLCVFVYLQCCTHHVNMHVFLCVFVFLQCCTHRVNMHIFLCVFVLSTMLHSPCQHACLPLCLCLSTMLHSPCQHACLPLCLRFSTTLHSPFQHESQKTTKHHHTLHPSHTPSHTAQRQALTCVWAAGGAGRTWGQVWGQSGHRELSCASSAARSCLLICVDKKQNQKTHSYCCVHLPEMLSTSDPDTHNCMQLGRTVPTSRSTFPRKVQTFFDFQKTSISPSLPHSVLLLLLLLLLLLSMLPVSLHLPSFFLFCIPLFMLVILWEFLCC